MKEVFIALLIAACSLVLAHACGLAFGKGAAKGAIEQLIRSK